MIVWLDSQVFHWYGRVESSSYAPPELFFKSYELWNHARDLIDAYDDEFHLADAITNLKRSLHCRQKLIEDLYCLRQIALPTSPKGSLEYLETFGLVRPLMLKELVEIRNHIEHHNARPPDRKRCAELLDITWYFLKSTDAFTRLQHQSAAYLDLDEDGRESQYGFSVTVDFKNGRDLQFSGWLPCEAVSDSSAPGWVPLKVKVRHTKEHWKGEPHHGNKLPSDVWVSGILEAGNDVKLLIFRTLLSGE